MYFSRDTVLSCIYHVSVVDLAMRSDWPASRTPRTGPCFRPCFHFPLKLRGLHRLKHLVSSQPAFCILHLVYRLVLQFRTSYVPFPAQCRHRRSAFLYEFVRIYRLRQLTSALSRFLIAILWRRLEQQKVSAHTARSTATDRTNKHRFAIAKSFSRSRSLVAHQYPFRPDRSRLMVR